MAEAAVFGEKRLRIIGRLCRLAVSLAQLKQIEGSRLRVFDGRLGLFRRRARHYRDKDLWAARRSPPRRT